MKCEICGEAACYLVNGQIGLCEDCMYAAGDDIEAYECEVEELDHEDDEEDA